VRTADRAYLIDLRDVGVLECADQARFIEKQPGGLVVSQLGAGALDDDDLLEALQAELARQPDLRHAAGREVTEQRVPAELLREDCIGGIAWIERGHAQLTCVSNA